MPIFRVETNQGTFEIEANREPTEAEIKAYVANGGQESPKAAEPVKPQPKAVSAPPGMAPEQLAAMAARAGGGGFMGGMVGQMVGPEARAELGNTVAQMGIRGAPPAIGQAIGAYTGPFAPAAVPVLGAIGGAGGEMLAQMREPGPMRPGAIVGAGAVGAIPGSPLSGMGVRALGKEAVKQGAGNLGATVIEKGVDQGRLPSLGEAGLSTGLGVAAPVIGKGLDGGAQAAKVAYEKLATKISDRNLLGGMELGYLLTPSVLAKSTNRGDVGAINSIVQGLGGLNETTSKIIQHNQRITDDAVAMHFGLPKGTRLERARFQIAPDGSTVEIPGTLDQMRDTQWAQPYRTLADMSQQAKRDLEVLESGSRLAARDAHELAVLRSDPAYVKKQAELSLKAGADVNELKALRYNMKEAFNDAARDGSPEALAKARKLRSEVKDLEETIAKAAEQMGSPELAAQLKESRRLYAQSYAVEAALDTNGNVSAPILGKLLDKDIPLTDTLHKIAAFEQSAGGAMREAQKAASPIPSKLAGTLAIGGGITGAATGNPYLAAAGVVAPFAVPKAAQAAMGSAPYQNLLLNPARQHNRAMPDAAAQFARFSTQSEGRQPNSFLQFLQKEFPNRQPAPYR